MTPSELAANTRNEVEIALLAEQKAMRWEVAELRAALFAAQSAVLTEGMAADELRAGLAVSQNAERLYRYALEAIVRADSPAGGCLPACASWLEDYRVNDCDCGYVSVTDNGASVFAGDVLEGVETIFGAFRDAGDRAADLARSGGAT